MKNRDSIKVVALVAGTMAVAGWLCFELLPARSGASASRTQASLAAREAASPLPGIRREGARLIVPVRAQIGGAELPAAPAAEADPAAPAAQPEKASASVIEQAKKLIADGKKPEARAALTEAILAAAEGPARDEMRGLLEQINAELFFSRSPSPDCIFYKVKAGDTLGKIALEQKKDPYFANVIMLVNGITNPKRIRPDQNLKIPQGSFSALVQKRAHRLIVLFNGQYIKEYAVTLGAAATPTPEATFAVDSKQVNPNWYAPDGTVYKFGDPHNILGTRWIGLKGAPEYQGYGIHGTTDPQSIGKDASNGCARMLNADVEEIFGMLMTGDAVKIVK